MTGDGKPHFSKPTPDGVPRWHDYKAADWTVTINPTQLLSGAARKAFKPGAEKVSRGFAVILDRGGARRALLQGWLNINKRYLVYVAGCNLELVIRLFTETSAPRRHCPGGLVLLWRYKPRRRDYRPALPQTGDELRSTPSPTGRMASNETRIPQRAVKLMDRAGSEAAMTSIKQSRRSRNMPLEAARGLASVIVLIWHCVCGFWPQQSGAFMGLGEGLRGSVFFFLINGPAWVIFFFVLSGYVLTRTFFITGNWSILVNGAVKRWPRLALPVLITTVLSSLIISLGFYRYSEVGKITGSPWLISFAGAIAGGFLPPNNISSALSQGILTFFRGDMWYNSNIWTMRYEFFGSIISFGCAALIFALRKNAIIASYIFGVSLISCFYTDPLYAAFPVGVALAALLPTSEVVIPGWLSLILLVICFYFLGYTNSAHGVYDALSAITGNIATERYLHVFSSVVLIVLLESSPEARYIFSGPIARFLGELSFSLYLVHIPVLCSVGCSTYLLAPAGLEPFFAAFATIVVSVAVAYPFAVVNRIWTGWLNNQVSRHYYVGPM